MIHLSRCRKSIQKVNRQTTNWEKRFTTYISKKELVSRTTLLLPNYKKQNNLVIKKKKGGGWPQKTEEALHKGKYMNGQ